MLTYTQSSTDQRQQFNVLERGIFTDPLQYLHYNINLKVQFKLDKEGRFFRFMNIQCSYILKNAQSKLN